MCNLSRDGVEAIFGRAEQENNHRASEINDNMVTRSEDCIQYVGFHVKLTPPEYNPEYSQIPHL